MHGRLGDLTVGDAHERIIPPLVEVASALKVGNGLEDGVDVGPVISAEACDRITDWIG
ncbi:MAG: aldehyde dehydrogenase family protein, partial [Solirubrobacterales bacterium]|nr:aldehyde dehydrogenase family protein [Solirubrobacterales bacterium]